MGQAECTPDDDLDAYFGISFIAVQQIDWFNCCPS